MQKNWSEVELNPVEPVRKKLQPPESDPFSVHPKPEDEKNELLLKAPRCDVTAAEKLALSSISLDEALGRSLRESSPELLLVSSSLRTASLPFGLNSSSSTEGSTDTSKVEASQTDGSLDSSLKSPLPQIVIIPTSETTLAEGQAEQRDAEEEDSELFFSRSKNHLLDIGRLSSSPDHLEAIEKLLS
ncbi:UNVERIFIED_CONTAM: hypothetical protein K2H54_028980 [Gekko kuhli]